MSSQAMPSNLELEPEKKSPLKLFLGEDEPKATVQNGSIVAPVTALHSKEVQGTLPLESRFDDMHLSLSSIVSFKCH